MKTLPEPKQNRVYPVAGGLLLGSLVLIAVLFGWTDYRQHEAKTAFNSTHDRARLETRMGSLRQELTGLATSRPSLAPANSVPLESAGPAKFANEVNLLKQALAQREPAEIAYLRTKANGAIDTRYFRVARELKLDWEQIDQFASLLVDRSSLETGIAKLARRASLNEADTAALRREALAENQQQLLALLGAAGYDRLVTDDAESVYVSFIEYRIAQRLHYTASPLRDDQARALIAALVADNPVIGIRPALGEHVMTTGARVLDQTQQKVLHEMKRIEDSEQQLLALRAP